MPLLSPPSSFHQIGCPHLQSDVLHAIQMALHSSTGRVQPDPGHIQSIQSALVRILQDETTEMDSEVKDRVEESIEVVELVRKVTASRRV